MKLFYAADKIIETPVFGKGNPTNDYGLGFYLTPDKKIARLWAAKNSSGGFVIEYDVNLTGLSVLRLDTKEDEDVLRWISLLAKHRFSRRDREDHKDTLEWLEKRFPVDVSAYDAVIGYRADDAYFAYSLDFVSNALSLEKLKEAMLLGRLGLQYVLISPKAFGQIRFVRSEEVPYSNEYEAFHGQMAGEYHKVRSEDSYRNTFLRDIMRKYDDQVR
ncbi:MAG: DUF3990 domain-containing protein [Erysipelotrichaceae bacterium]|nr:DUF3990 domain-containing protein [Erysipelotrichaceae bacterium]